MESDEIMKRMMEDRRDNEDYNVDDVLYIIRKRET